MADDGQALLLTISADTSKALKSLEGLNKKLSGLGSDFEKHGKKAAEGLEKGLGSVNIGKALDKIFDRSRFAVLEEGSSRLSVFGSALEPLGPLGLAAAAGLAAFGVSLEEAHKAMEYAESVQHLAEVLGTTTDKVQELNYASAASGVNAEAAKAGIQELTTAIGAYQSNVKDKRVASVFEALCITKAEARTWKDPIDGLQAIAEKLEKVGSQSERVALAKALRFPPELLPLLDGLVAKMAAAKANGAVIDADSVKRAAELNKQLAATTTVISVQLKEAFINLAPAVEAIAKLVAEMAKNANLFAQHMFNGGGLGHIDYSAMTEDALKNEARLLNTTRGGNLGRADLQDELRRSGVQFDAHGNVVESSVSADLKDPYSGSGQDLQTYRNAQAQWLQLGAELNKRFKADATPVGSGGPAKPLAAEVAKALPKDTSAEELSRAQATLQGAEEKLSKSYEKLTGNIDDATRNQIDAISHARDKELASLTADRQKLIDEDNTKIKTLSQAHTKVAEAEIKNIKANEAKILAANGAAQADIALAASNETVIAARENELEHLRASAQAAQDAAAVQETDLRNRASLLTAQAGLAVTAKERNDVERQALVLQQKADAELADAKLEQARAILEQVKKATPGNADAITHAQAGVDAAQANVDFVKSSQPLQTAQFDRDHADPIAKFKESIQDLRTEVQNDAVGAFQDLTSGLVDAALHAKNLGDVAKNVFLNLIQQILTQTLQKEALPGLEAAGSALLHFIPGFASGTSSAPGGLALVGEQGPELVNLPRGASVTPKFQTLDALRAMKAPTAVKGGNVTLQVNVEAGGAISKEAIEGMVYRGSQDAVRQARALAAGDFSKAAYNANMNQ